MGIVDYVLMDSLLSSSRWGRCIHQLSSKANMECEICFERFDNNQRKPRNLPRGHVYCNHCLGTGLPLST